MSALAELCVANAAGFFLLAIAEHSLKSPTCYTVRKGPYEVNVAMFPIGPIELLLLLAALSVPVLLLALVIAILKKPRKP